MPTRNKKEILLQNDRYKSSITAVERKLKAIVIDFDKSQDLFSTSSFGKYFDQQSNTIQELYQSLNSLKMEHEDLILEAVHRPAKIKTGGVKKQIQNQIDIIQGLEQQVDKKLLELVQLYEDRSHQTLNQHASEAQIAQIIDSLAKTREFCENNGNNPVLIEKITQAWRSGVQNQAIHQRINAHWSMIAGLDGALRALQKDHTILQNKVKALEKKLNKPSKQSDNMKAAGFFKTDNTQLKNIEEKPEEPSSNIEPKK